MEEKELRGLRDHHMLARVSMISGKSMDSAHPRKIKQIAPRFSPYLAAVLDTMRRTDGY